MRAVFAMKPDDRRQHAVGFEGRKVRVEWSGLRDRKDTTVDVGQVLTVALSNLSGGADFLVLRRGLGLWDLALSLATIISIEEE
jgi:hypothetical protein